MEESDPSCSSVSSTANVEVPEFDRSEWIPIKIPFLEEESIRSEICYSPSGRYALIAGYKSLPLITVPEDDDDDVDYVRDSRVFIVDLIKRKMTHLITIKYELVHWYWLNEFKITLVASRRNDLFIQSIYCLYFEDPSKQPELINSLATNVGSPVIHMFAASVASKLIIHGYEFLLLKMFGVDWVLLPYNLNKMAPHLPMLKLHISAEVTSLINGLYHRDPESPPLLVPRKINDGLYKVPDGNVFRGNRIWYIQNGPIIVFHSRTENDKVNLKVWVLNLEDETINERTMTMKPCCMRTLYKNMFLMWKETDNNEILFKFYGIASGFPKLMDLCKTVLISSKVANPLFQIQFEKLSRF